MGNIEDKIKQLANHTFGTWNRQSAWTAPLLIKDAKGVYFYDYKDNPYIDFSSQLVCSSLGHKNEAIIEAVIKQAQRLPYIAPGFVTQVAMDAVEAIQSMMPEGLNKFFFSTSGAEANDGALIMTRQSQAPKYKVMSRYHSFHGATSAGMAFTGDPRRVIPERAKYTVEGILFAPDCYCYRCPFGNTYPECNIQCARYTEYMIKEDQNVAAMIVEPVVGTNGRIVPPPEYFPLIRKICDENNVLLIADEVMTGWFRTGKKFAVDHWDVKPDILTTAKGCTSAYTPLGITAASDKVATFFDDEMFCHGHTYAYHALSLSAVAPAVSEYKRIEAAGIIKAGSAHLKKELFKLADCHECIGDVRGIGHIWGFELVKNRKTKAAFNVKEDKITGAPLMTGKVSAECFKNGLYVMPWYDNLIIAPPLIITRDEIDTALHILDNALRLADEEVESTGIAVSKSSEFSQ